MSYVDGFVVPVPTENRDAYRKVAGEMAAIFKEHGATRVVECWGDDVPPGKVTDFQQAVKAEDGESLVFAWIEYPSKDVRDAVVAKTMADPRIEPNAPMPFDSKRMIFGGFETILDA